MKKRVKIPVNRPKEILDLARKIQMKHVADGDASLLKVLNWQKLIPAINQTQEAHEKAERLKREMLEAYQQRDLLVNPVLEIIRDSRDILTGAYKKEMKTLGQWGYEVLDVRTNKIEKVPDSK